MRARCLPPAAGPEARILILGSMPGRLSLARQEYYGNPHNMFWTIIERIFAIPAALPYPARLAGLGKARCALWDVVASCARAGSLDSAIRAAVPNDFGRFYAAHRRIEAVFFNGKTAERIYRRRVWPGLARAAQELRMTGLPSTSPAFAQMKSEQKAVIWRRAIRARL